MSATRRVARNFGWLLSGRGAGALLALAATALMARNLGPEPFGMIILLHTSAHILRHLCSVKSSEATIRFGQQLLNRSDGRSQPTAAWLALVGALFRFDLLIALAAATLGAAGLAFAAQPMGLPAELADAAWIYVAALMCTATGAAKGALRGLDRYRLLSIQLTAAPALRLAGVAACVAFATPIEWYVTVWGASLMLEHVLLLASAAPYLGLTQLGAPIRPALATQPKLAPFLKAVYWQSNLDMVPRHGATLAVGLLFGAHSAGIYRLARDIAEVVSKPVVLLRQAIFPDLTELWAQDKGAFLTLTWRASAFLALIGGLFVLAALAFGADLLVLLAGEPFRAGSTLLALLLGAAAVELGAAPLRPASYAMDRVVQVLILQSGAVILFFATLFATKPLIGLVGAGWAALASASASLLGMVWAGAPNRAERIGRTTLFVNQWMRNSYERDGGHGNLHGDALLQGGARAEGNLGEARLRRYPRFQPRQQPRLGVPCHRRPRHQGTRGGQGARRHGPLLRQSPRRTGRRGGANAARRRASG